MISKESNNVCQNSGSGINDNFCSSCGEKKVEEADFSLKAIISISLNAVTNIDSKLFKTILVLMFKPGKLTEEYINGIRKKYMQPFQLFVLANLLFFFITDIDMFRIPAKWDFDQPETKAIAEEIALTKSITFPEVMILYDSQVTSLSKSLVIVVIPFLGLLFLMLNYKKNIY